jgi:predicted enzyme related to lactoylglutathione lyase
MKVYYLEIVASDVGAVCAAYEAAHGIKFGSPDLLLGSARTAPLSDGGSIGVRGPLRDTEKPIVRPYWLVDDIKVALDAASKQGALVAHPPLEIPGKGTFAIYIQGDVDHGLWQL